MSEQNSHGDESVPQSRVRRRRKIRFSLVWIIPIIAALAGAWIAAVKIMNQGPTITIELRTAEGLTAGKTEIKYNGVTIGTVEAIRLTADHSRVLATASMAPHTGRILVADTQFWVVRPRISGANVSGLGTLISGAYIGMEIGKSTQERRKFVALAEPPVVTGEVPGRFFVLKTANLGSVDYGTPIYFRRLKVGQVASYDLDPGGQTLTVKVFINAPYDKLVTSETRWWQASGLNMSLTANGLSVQTESMLSMLIGGLAFQTPASAAGLPEASADAEFKLYKNRADAFRPPPVNPQRYMLVFDESVRGLDVGAPVEVEGIDIGSVQAVQPEFDAKTNRFKILVTIGIDPRRLGVKIVDASGEEMANRQRYRETFDALVAHGFRAQLATGSLLTGAKYIDLGFFPDAKPFKIDWSHSPPMLGTVPGKFAAIDADIAGILSKLNKLPYQETVADVRKTLANLDATLTSATDTLNQARTLLKSNADLGDTLTNTLQELSRAAQSLRVLADYLERHPEALIHGKTKEHKP